MCGQNVDAMDREVYPVDEALKVVRQVRIARKRRLLGACQAPRNVPHGSHDARGAARRCAPDREETSTSTNVHYHDVLALWRTFIRPRLLGQVQPQQLTLAARRSKRPSSPTRKTSR